jgi:hypothetical protein
MNYEKRKQGIAVLIPGGRYCAKSGIDSPHSVANGSDAKHGFELRAGMEWSQEDGIDFLRDRIA